MGASGQPIRVVVVDDSVLIRTMLRSALEADGDIVVAGAAGEPFEARDVIKQTNPDVVTLDVEMPNMNGLEFLDKIMTLRPMPVVMVSSLTSAGAEATLNALETGAVDFIAKPAGGNFAAQFAESVRRKVRGAARAQVRRKETVSRSAGSVTRAAGSANLIAIGASTGGVAAIGSLVGKLPMGLPPIVATIHMPEKYTGRFANRLATQTGHNVKEASDGESLTAGMIRIAPGNRHLELAKGPNGYVTRLSDGDLVSGHRPSVDVMFRSVAKTVGKKAMGVILTGMGRDGADGLLKMRSAGSVCLGEAESSCVVYGMPKAAMEAGAVSEEHDLSRLPGRLCELIAGPAKR